MLFICPLVASFIQSFACCCETSRHFLCRHYTPIPLCRKRQLGRYCGMFHLQHTSGKLHNNIYTREIQTSNYLRIRPKMEFLCYANDKYYMNDVTKSQKAECVQVLNIKRGALLNISFVKQINRGIYETQTDLLNTSGNW